MHHHHHHDDDLASDRIGIAFALNVSFTIIEFIGGVLTNSTAIMADAVHDLGDSLSIGLAWLLNKLSARESNNRFTYGYRRFSLLGALINGFILLLGSGWILSEAIPKLSNPEMPVVEGMLGLSLLGIAVNGFAAWKLSAGKTMNERMLNWHLLEDALGWAAVLLVSIILMFVDWPILDPLLSIVFTLFILFNVGKTLWKTTLLFLQAVPDANMANRVGELLRADTEVTEVHHLHLWSLDGEEHVLSAHLVLAKTLGPAEQLALKRRMAQQLSVFEFAHTTLELELPEEICRDRDEAAEVE
ncbi:cation diffusion facilitator family transporter [Luminiphilus syltensis NOR5-1B]|uniref:Cation diffusion facilitator family transporter n=1 Tax=Luminiphilus syltensis NOR5-1B TaxID=565045 RepID=B8KWP2_9GAMM|nr:cation diffusion facilitator family transporter [Luminiphilus syltensis]EED36857.1 cation diffusion facilitator family transporter [Luminiphilus syltensis NOR5-1B]